MFNDEFCMLHHPSSMKVVHGELQFSNGVFPHRLPVIFGHACERTAVPNTVPDGTTEEVDTVPTEVDVTVELTKSSLVEPDTSKEEDERTVIFDGLVTVTVRFVMVMTSAVTVTTAWTVAVVASSIWLDRGVLEIDLAHSVELWEINVDVGIRGGKIPELMSNCEASASHPSRSFFLFCIWWEPTAEDVVSEIKSEDSARRFLDFEVGASLIVLLFLDLSGYLLLLMV
ncbi:hypothetical protein E6O75_ATG06084 [Venturia nashicola]|uniref:Uncharacterized protein n=1 Tax=Venturia nashicola TaxID=86259 RepID=A0A4Z1PCV7_9PEZI|nr:hypothetical protein E6O75_ATG06084 [Venturia nashicola]